jgi:hypothetical protein
MHVVSTGVHHAGISRRVLEVRILVNGERVDVAANRDYGRSRIATGDARDDASARDTMELLGTQHAQRVGQPVRGALLTKSQLRIAMDVPAELE